MDLVQKREMILEQEANFAASIGSAVIEKPKITCRVILMPFMFIFLIYDTLKLKSNRRKFQNEFMTERRQAIDIAFEATLSGSKPRTHRMVWKSTCVDTLEKPFSSWIEALVDYYGDLFLAVGDNFKGLVRSAYRNRTNYLLILNHLNRLEREFYAALTACMQATEGAADVIAGIQKESRRLRMDLAEQIFS